MYLLKKSGGIMRKISKALIPLIAIIIIVVAIFIIKLKPNIIDKIGLSRSDIEIILNNSYQYIEESSYSDNLKKNYDSRFCIIERLGKESISSVVIDKDSHLVESVDNLTGNEICVIFPNEKSGLSRICLVIDPNDFSYVGFIPVM